MKSLAIERESGTGGWELGKRIAETEGIPFYDEAAIIKNAEQMGHKLTLLKNYEEKKKESILYNIAMVANKETELKVEIQKMVLELFSELKETIEQLQARGTAVFVGTGVCGFASKPDEFVKIFLCNSRAKENGVYEQNASIKDKQRSIYFWMLTQKEWENPQNYDFVYDVAKINKDNLYQTVIQELKKYN